MGARSSVRSWLSSMAQKNGISAKTPFELELPIEGTRNPVWRSLRIGAAKKGIHGINGIFQTQNEALVPVTYPSRSDSAFAMRNDQWGFSGSQVVNTPRLMR